ncbi:DUF3139 domain-containing protein [Amphibacillus sediminis]|uniref:DUF3139 domain-containing protein n=1 Tax=Amphibacillus sediminis TaxID=360185 RepID=UPI00082CDB4A|nr:DUF3139 domain-containing protein [Amphibacillus sediminis]
MKKILLVLAIALILLSYPSYRIIIKAQASNKITTAIEELGYDEYIKEHEIKYDSKRGTYFVEVIYIGEEDYLYTYDINSGKIFTIVFDETNTEINDVQKGLKYIIEE